MPDKKTAQKVSHFEKKVAKRRDDPTENFLQAISGRLGSKRLINRLINGRKVMPCGRECWEYGLMIAEGLNHGSFMNFNELMNDEEFILHIAKITPNPTECENYFYQYVNPYLRRRKDFNVKFLKQVYLNDNVYKLKDINLIVEWAGLQKENEMILQDLEFKKLMELRLAQIDYREMTDYHCSGLDDKELHDYKVKANDAKVLCENVKNGLKEIIGAFAKEKTEEEEFDDFYYDGTN